MSGTSTQQQGAVAQRSAAPPARLPVVGRVDAWLLAPAPAPRLAALRIAVAGYATIFLLARLPGLLQVADLPPTRFDPVGPLSWMAGPLPPGVARAVLAATILAGVAVTLGWRHRVTGPVFALSFLAVATYRVSWGHVIHTDHLPALHLLVLAVAPAAEAWSLDARRRARRGRGGPPPGAAFGWPVRVMAVLTVLTYVLAGWAKVRNGGLDWAVGDVLRNQVAFDNLRKVLLGDVHSPLGAWLVRYPVVFPPLALASLAVELGAPLALVGGRARTAWVGAAWAFHVGIAALMAIAFPYELTAVAFAPLLPLERLGQAGLRAARRWRSR